MALNGLSVPTYAPWYPELRSELLRFPSGRHDNQVDALGLVGQLLDTMVVGTVPKTVEPGRRDGYREVRDDRYSDSTVTL